MSTPSEKIASVLVASDAQKPSPTKKRPRGQPYKARMATKVKWALSDTMERAVRSQRIMKEMLVWLDEEWGAVGTEDRCRLVRLGRFEHMLTSLALEVAEMERITARAVAESRPEVK